MIRIGSKFDAALRPAEIARRVRAGIKAAIVAGLLPAGAYAVRSDATSISIVVSALASRAGPHPLQRRLPGGLPRPQGRGCFVNRRTPCLLVQVGPAVHLLAVDAALDPAQAMGYLLRLERELGPCEFTWWDGQKAHDLGDLEEACHRIDEVLASVHVAPVLAVA